MENTETMGQPEMFSATQIQQAKEMVESWREEAMNPVAIEELSAYLDFDILEREHVIEFLRSWTNKYLDSAISSLITSPRLIKTNQDMILELEKALETMSEDDFAYEDIKATRMATINQIKTIK
jgi:hypothetical protein